LLEQRLGVQVLERSRRGSTLTKYGEILARRAEGLQVLLEDAEAEVRLAAKGILGPLRIGATPSVLPNLMPKVIASLSQSVGRFDMEIVEDLDNALLPMLASGALNIIVGPVNEMFATTSSIQEVALVKDPFVLGMNPGNKLASRKDVKLKDLHEASWILPREGSTYRSHIESLFRVAGLPWPTDCLVANSMEFMEAALETSDRVAILSRVQVREPSRLAIRPLEPAVERLIGYKVRGDLKLSPLGALFVQSFRDVAETLNLATSGHER